MGNEGPRPSGLLKDIRLPGVLDRHEALSQLFHLADEGNDVLIYTADGEPLRHPGFISSLVGSINNKGKAMRVIRVLINPESCRPLIESLPQHIKDLMVQMAEQHVLAVYATPVKFENSYVVVGGGKYLGCQDIINNSGQWFVCGIDVDGEPEKYEGSFNRIVRLPEVCHYLRPNDLNDVLMGQPPPFINSKS